MKADPLAITTLVSLTRATQPNTFYWRWSRKK